MSPPRVLVPIATGSEEIETTCITDTLTRFGAEVVIASVMPQSSEGAPLVCKMSRGIKFLADVHISECAVGTGNDNWDLIALPGGMPGAEHLRDCPEIVDLLKKQKSANKFFAAVCASPAVVLASHNLIASDAASTCYPAPPFREKLLTVSEDSVVVTDNMITSQGPGTSLKFALVLGELLFGKEKADEIAKQMLVER
eukprot:CAMPEP_0196807264 /NCGR_PEP_ID=MMETSP1362-20130617/7225_1 /TAXON_ID=163516 /ORGANISM="Leptocylindrus danicus, Strain CCMP1856" /LENGTH=197 /DNA_ID=CAMNT_0042181105 /DNA_START=156 /DNA_END=749 /DNA_ORIENTATION=-